LSVCGGGGGGRERERERERDTERGREEHSGDEGISAHRPQLYGRGEIEESGPAQPTLGQRIRGERNILKHTQSAQERHWARKGSPGTVQIGEDWANPASVKCAGGTHRGRPSRRIYRLQRNALGAEAQRRRAPGAADDQPFARPSASRSPGPQSPPTPHPGVCPIPWSLPSQEPEPQRPPQAQSRRTSSLRMDTREYFYQVLTIG